MKKNGFTLLELLLSIGIFTIILAIIAQLSTTTLKSWRRVSDRQTQFAEAKIAFDSIQARLSQAELNPYWGFEFGSGTNNSPTSYKRLSDLHFVTGESSELTTQNHFSHAVFFHGAFGISREEELSQFGSLINSWGYFVDFGNSNDADVLDGQNVQDRFRFRLMELQVDAEDVSTFQTDMEDENQLDLNEFTDRNMIYKWFREPIADDQAYVLAENVIALIISPLPRTIDGVAFDETTLAPDYLYDTREFQYSNVENLPSEHQLPPILRITMVVISEGSAFQLADGNGSNPPLSLIHI